MELPEGLFPYNPDLLVVTEIKPTFEIAEGPSTTEIWERALNAVTEYALAQIPDGITRGLYDAMYDTIMDDIKHLQPEEVFQLYNQLFG